MTKLAYFDCATGISGDMTLAALVDLGVAVEQLNAAIASLGLSDCRIAAKEVRKNGFRATQITVECPPEQPHRHLHHILAMIEGSCLTGRQKDLARRVFTRLGEAEAKVHGQPIEKIHFHEVGAADSIADIVGTAVGLDLLGVERVAASPVPTGSGTIRIAHGQCSIPAPATAELLRGIPLAASTIESELTTPTGAAILATLAETFGPLPAMTIERIGCGAGQKDFTERPNLLRLLVGRAVDPAVQGGPGTDQVCVLETNLDDLSGELIGHCIARLWEAEALEVFSTAVQTKKNRPGVMLTVLCRPGDAPAMEDILFRETTTLGIRRRLVDRRVLARQTHSVTTPWGPVEGKIGWPSPDSPRFSPEYESCCRVAAEHNVPLREVYEAARKAFAESVGRGPWRVNGPRLTPHESPTSDL